MHRTKPLDILFRTNIANFEHTFEIIGADVANMQKETIRECLIDELIGIVGRELKAKTPLAEALREALSMTPFQFEDQWKAFVMESYSSMTHK